MTDSQDPHSPNPETPPSFTALDRAVWALPFEDISAEELDAMDAESALDVDAAWAQLAATFPTPKRALRQPLRVSSYGRRAIRVWRQYPIHSSSIALVAVYLFGVQLDRRYVHPLYYYHAGVAEQVVTLPDHSTAWLAPGAYLSTDRTFIKGPRTVYLFGQARFAVAHDPARPFSVHVLEVRATALGTTFTVASDTTARVMVTVHDGKVVLDMLSPDGTPSRVAVLTAGQVQDVPALTSKFAKIGYMTAQVGIPWREAAQIQAALLRAAATMVPAARK